jgi:hypothetical protein
LEKVAEGDITMPELAAELAAATFKAAGRTEIAEQGRVRWASFSCVILGACGVRLSLDHHSGFSSRYSRLHVIHRRRDSASATRRQI